MKKDSKPKTVLACEEITDNAWDYVMNRVENNKNIPLKYRVAACHCIFGKLFSISSGKIEMMTVIKKENKAAPKKRHIK